MHPSSQEAADLRETLYWEFDSERAKHGEERLRFKSSLDRYAASVIPRPVYKYLIVSYKNNPETAFLFPESFSFSDSAESLIPRRIKIGGQWTATLYPVVVSCGYTDFLSCFKKNEGEPLPYPNRPREDLDVILRIRS